MSRRMLRPGGTFIAGMVLVFAATCTRADDSCCSFPDCFAFFRRCPPDAGVQNATVGAAVHRLCRPPRCPPYFDPNFGFYSTAWRSWPTMYGEAIEASTSPAAKPPSDGKAPAVMPPATDIEARRQQAKPGSVVPAVRTTADPATISVSSVR